MRNKKPVSIVLSENDIKHLKAGEILIFNGYINVEFKKPELTYEQFVEAMREGATIVAPGRLFIPIRWLRDYMDLTYSEFDKYLKQMRYDLLIQLNPGDRSELTQEELKNSFTDEFGDVYITFCWK